MLASTSAKTGLNSFETLLNSSTTFPRFPPAVTFSMAVLACAGDPVALRNVFATLAPQVPHVSAAFGRRLRRWKPRPRRTCPRASARRCHREAPLPNGRTRPSRRPPRRGSRWSAAITLTTAAAATNTATSSTNAASRCSTPPKAPKRPKPTARPHDDQDRDPTWCLPSAHSEGPM